MDKQTEHPSLSPFSQLLAQLRKQRGLSMQKLAVRSGISAAYVCRLESGERHPSRDLVIKLTDILLEGATQLEKDEVLVAAGFAPINYRNFLGREDVVAIYENTLRLQPDDFKTYLALVYSLIRSGEYQRADEAIQAGFTRFSERIQLNALKASLALAKGQFEQARTFQEEALQGFGTHPDPTLLHVREVDLLLSLGVICFEEAHLEASAWSRAVALHQLDAAAGAFAAALRHLQNARDHFKRALAQCPQDIYILDELARVHFTWAYLLPDAEALPNWREACTAFEKTICAPDKAVLGAEPLLQSTVFLALTYSKLGRFEQAWFTLSIVEACVPNYWLVHYIKACYWGLRLKASSSESPEQQAHLSAQSLGALQQALACSDSHNQTRQEALYEPDLAFVRSLNSEEFERLLSTEVTP